MHFNGTIWRPPYEAGSLLLQVTAGCTHHACKFCTLYDDLPFRFRMSPMSEIEADLQEAQLLTLGPLEQISARMQGLPPQERLRRAFLVGPTPLSCTPASWRPLPAGSASTSPPLRASGALPG